MSNYVGTKMGPDQWWSVKNNLIRSLIAADQWYEDECPTATLDRQILLDLMATIELSYNPAPSTRFVFQ